MNATKASGWKPEMGSAENTAPATASGDRALMLEEALIFELAAPGGTGVDFEAVAGEPMATLNRHLRQDIAALSGLSEPESVRHYTRLSRQNYAIDLGMFPLGSCTMKHNPRLNEKIARMKGFADIHPLAPAHTVQGALAVIHELAHWLVTLTGMKAVAMSPKAGAHGELCGILAIRAALEARGDARSTILVPESAHGTNPATAARTTSVSQTASCQRSTLDWMVHATSTALTMLIAIMVPSWSRACCAWAMRSSVSSLSSAVEKGARMAVARSRRSRGSPAVEVRAVGRRARPAIATTTSRLET